MLLLCCWAYSWCSHRLSENGSVTRDHTSGTGGAHLSHVQSIPERHQLCAETFQALLQVDSLIRRCI